MAHTKSKGQDLVIYLTFGDIELARSCLKGLPLPTPTSETLWGGGSSSAAHTPLDNSMSPLPSFPMCLRTHLCPDMSQIYVFSHDLFYNLRLPSLTASQPSSLVMSQG